MANYRKIIGNKVRGWNNRENGLLFEKEIENACKMYSSAEIAEIEKTPEPFCVTQSIGSGKFVGHFGKKAQPDFKGTLANGRAVVFEAKFTSTEKILQSVVTDEQAQKLDKYQKMGALCFVMVSFGFKEYFRVPWEVFRAMSENFGRKYISPNDLAEYRVDISKGWLDFLKGERK